MTGRSFGSLGEDENDPQDLFNLNPVILPSLPRAQTYWRIGRRYDIVPLREDEDGPQG